MSKIKIKTKKEILDKHIKTMLNRTNESYCSIEEIKEQPEYQTTLDAMLELEDEIKNVFIDHLLAKASKQNWKYTYSKEDGVWWENDNGGGCNTAELIDMLKL